MIKTLFEDLKNLTLEVRNYLKCVCRKLLKQFYKPNLLEKSA